MSDVQRNRPPRRDFRRGSGGGGGFNRGAGGGFNRGGGYRRERPVGPAGPSIDYRALVEFVAKSLAEKLGLKG